MENYELIIIGAGPAGLSAAIYASRGGIRTRVFGCTPKYAGDYEIDNYYGFPETISGRELQERGLKHAARFGAEIGCERVLAIHQDESGSFVVKTEDTESRACALILATGVSRVKPGIKNLGDYEGKGVSYCVSCDGFFFRGKPVIVVGEANFAANQALELTNYTPKVTVVTQGKPLAMSPEFRQALQDADIPLIEGKIETLEGQSGLERVLLADGTSLEAHGLFVALGEASSSDFAYTLGVERNGQFIVADYDQKTNVPGIFAAGDCTGGFMQISVAVGEGAKAGHSAINFIRSTCRTKDAPAAS